MNLEEQLQEFTVEVLGYLEGMHAFHKDPDMFSTFRKISAWSARVSWMRNYALRHVGNKACQRFKLDTADPFLAEIDRQHKIYSRLITMSQQSMNQQGRYQ